MNIIEFYKQLSRILTDCRERFITKDEAKVKLEELVKQAKKSKLEVEISDDILDEHILMKLDDENSFTEIDWENNSSYDTDDSFSF